MADEPREIRSASDLRLDTENANKGTKRGAELLRESMDTCGIGRGVLADKHGVLIAGNKTVERAVERGAEIEVVRTRGDELVVVQRMDLDLITDPKARQLAYYDNRVNQVDLSWNPRQLNEDILAGVNVSVAFFPEEVGKILDGKRLTPITPEERAAKGAKEQSVQDVTGASYALTFDNAAQRVRWAQFVRRLKAQHTSASTTGARIAAHLTAEGIEASGEEY